MRGRLGPAGGRIWMGRRFFPSGSGKSVIAYATSSMTLDLAWPCCVSNCKGVELKPPNLP